MPYHLGMLRRGFESKRFTEDIKENAGETTFLFNMDDGRILACKGTTTVGYTDVVSGGKV